MFTLTWGRCNRHLGGLFHPDRLDSALLRVFFLRIGIPWDENHHQILPISFCWIIFLVHFFQASNKHIQDNRAEYDGLRSDLDWFPKWRSLILALKRSRKVSPNNGRDLKNLDFEWILLIGILYILFFLGKCCETSFEPSEKEKQLPKNVHPDSWSSVLCCCFVGR